MPIKIDGCYSSKNIICDQFMSQMMLHMNTFNYKLQNNLLQQYQIKIANSD